MTKKRWDWHSRDGRAALDEGALDAARAYGRPVARRNVAEALGLATTEEGLRNVGASLKRLAAAGKLSRSGDGAATVYDAVRP